MAIVINGSGTVTGLAVGGLPDGTVDSDTIATGTIVDADVANVAASKLTGALPAISGANLTGITSADNTPSFYASASGTQSINKNTYTKLTFDTESWDTDNAFSSSRFTVPSGEGGKYVFSGRVGMTELGDDEYIAIRLYKNGSAVDHSYSKFASANPTGGSIYPFLSFVVTMSAGDYMELYTYHNENDNPRNTIGNSAYFAGYKLAGA